MKQSLYITIILTLILGACQPVLQSTPESTIGPEQSLPTFTPTPQISDPLVISPENIDQLEITDRWGKGWVFGVALSPDEQMLAVATDTGVYIYSFPDLEQINYLDITYGSGYINGKSLINSVAFSPDATKLAIIGEYAIYSWNVKQNILGLISSTYIANCPPVDIAYSSNGKSLIVFGHGRCLHPDVWSGNYLVLNIENQEIIYQHTFMTEGNPIFFFRVLENNKVAFVEEGKNLKIVDTDSGTLVHSDQYSQTIYSINEDGTKLNQMNDILNTYSKTIIEQNEAVKYFLPNTTNTMIIPYGAMMKSLDQNGNIVCEFPITFNIKIPDHIAMGSRIQGKYLTFWNPDTQYIEIWDITRCRLFKEVFFPYYQNEIEFEPDGDSLSAGNNHTTNILNMDNGEVIASHPSFSEETFANTDEQSRYFLSPDGIRSAQLLENTLTFYRLDDERVTRQINFPYMVEKILFSDDWSKFAIFSNNHCEIRNIDGSLHSELWHYDSFDFDDHTGNVQNLITPYEEVIISAAFSPDNRLLAIFQYSIIGNRGEDFSIWDVSTGKKIYNVVNTNYIRDIKFSPDGRNLYMVNNNVIYVWGIKEE